MVTKFRVVAWNRVRFGRVPEKYVFSEFISDHGLRIIAYIDASKSDHSGFGRGMRWPVYSMSEIAAVIRSKERTAKSEVAKLRDLGLIETTKTFAGNRYILTGAKIIGDTYRGRENLKDNRYARLTIDTITFDVSSTALRLWMILDRIRGTRAYAHVSQQELASYLGCSPITVARHMKVLREKGLVSVRHEHNGNGFGLNRYKPILVEDTIQRQAYRVVTTWLREVAGKWVEWSNAHPAEFAELLTAACNAIERRGYESVLGSVYYTLYDTRCTDPMKLLNVLEF